MCFFAIRQTDMHAHQEGYGFFYRLPHALSAAYSTVSSALGVVLTAMFIACAAYVVAGVSAILDLWFIAINKRRNFKITTVVRLKK